MSERARSRIYAGLIAALAVTLAVLIATSPTDQDRVARIGASIMCPVCQGESIGSSIAPMARDMMGLVQERVAQGASDQQIIGELLSAYGGSILLDPPVSGPTLLLWAAPVVALVAGLGVIAWWRSHPGAATLTPQAGRDRKAVGALVLIASVAAILVTVGYFLQERDDVFGGIADVDVTDLDRVSNETMEAAIAANRDHPQISGMRLALADRYLEEGEYRAAFPHYLGVAESEGSSAAQRVAALAGLGWMTWDGNREAETAIALFDEALAIDPASVPVRYLKAHVLRCTGWTEESGSMLQELLAMDTLDASWRATATAELEALEQEEACT